MTDQENQYKSASIEATVNVRAYRELVENGGYAARTVDLSFKEHFSDDAELDAALEAFTKTVKEAARR